MLKRAMAAIQKRFFPGQQDKTSSDEVIRVARRQFFTRATLGAASVTGTATLTKMVIDSVPQPDLHQRYAKDASNGEQELRERKYVLMSEREITDMVQTFVDDYANNK